MKLQFIRRWLVSSWYLPVISVTYITLIVGFLYVRKFDYHGDIVWMAIWIGFFSYLYYQAYKSWRRDKRKR